MAFMIRAFADFKEKNGLPAFEIRAFICFLNECEFFKRVTLN